LAAFRFRPPSFLRQTTFSPAFLLARTIFFSSIGGGNTLGQEVRVRREATPAPAMTAPGAAGAQWNGLGEGQGRKSYNFGLGEKESKSLRDSPALTQKSVPFPIPIISTPSLSAKFTQTQYKQFYLNFIVRPNCASTKCCLPRNWDSKIFQSSECSQIYSQ
jgi:hypothetical protein